METKKQMNPEVKNNVITGTSAAVGAAAGVVIGNVVSPAKAEAAETTDADETVEEPVEPEVNNLNGQEELDIPVVDVPENNNIDQPVAPEEPVVNVTPDESAAPKDTIEVTVNVHVDSNGQPVATAEVKTNGQEIVDGPEVPATPGTNDMPEGVIAYETVQVDNGQIIDVATINADGQLIHVVDADKDGMADVAVSDLNNNGQLDANEVEDISMHGVDMATLEQQAEANQMLINGPDYVDNANVDEFTA